MVKHGVIGQINLFNIEDYNTKTVASNFDMGLSISDTSTRSKASLRPHNRPITKETIEKLIITLTSLPILT